MYEVVEKGWIQARIAELPGVITTAPTRAEAMELLHDALREYILALPATDVSKQTPALRADASDVLEIAVSS